MIFSSTTGYCKDCVIAIVKEEEMRRENEERKKQEEEARRKAEEHQRPKDKYISHEERVQQKRAEIGQRLKEKEQQLVSLLQEDGVYYYKEMSDAGENRYIILRFFRKERQVILACVSNMSAFVQTSDLWRKWNFLFLDEKMGFASYAEYGEIIKDEFLGIIGNNNILMSDKRTYCNGDVKTINDMEFKFISDDEIYNGNYLQETIDNHRKQQDNLNDKEKVNALKTVFLEQLRDLLVSLSNMKIVGSIFDLYEIDDKTYKPLIDKAVALKREGKYIEACDIWYSIIMRTNSLAASIIDSWGKTLIVAGDVIDAAVLASIQGMCHKKQSFYPETLNERIVELRRLANNQEAFMSRLKEYSGNDNYNMQASNIDVLSHPDITDSFVNNYSDFSALFVIPRLSSI